MKRLPPEVEPALAAAVKDEDSHVRVYAAGALWRLTRKGDAAKPIMLEGIKSSDHRLCEEALLNVRNIGPDAAELLPAVRELLKDEDRGIARAAQDTIDRLEGRDPWARGAEK
jgi:HEAT repeat protein